MESKELRQTELPQRRSSDEVLFVRSLKTPQIVQRPLEDLKEVLRLIMIKMGLRGENYPVDEEKEVLLSHIVEKFGNHTHEEIKLAFDMAMEGKLNPPDDPKFAVCFENFSCAYFTKIMMAYREWAAKTYKSVVKEKPKAAPTEELSDIVMQEMWNKVSLEVRTKNLPYFSVYPSLYEWAKERGMVTNSGLKKAEYFKLAVSKKIEELTEMYRNDKSAEIKKQLEDYQRMEKFSIVEAYYVPTVAKNAKQLMIHRMMMNETNINEGNSDLVGGDAGSII
jgi:hypothetical protein